MRRAIGIGFVAIALLAGCAGKVSAPATGTEAAAADPNASIRNPNTPQNLIEAVAKSWNRLDWEGYRDLLTEDFQFSFAESDSAGNDYRVRPFGRFDEIAAVHSMFVTGTSVTPPLTRVLLAFERSFVVQPDSRPGKAFPWHQEIRTNFTLLADNATTSYRITGVARFLVVRGDSALIPPELVARGFRPDPRRWWVERWEDESLSPASLPRDAAMPARSFTLGQLKVLYLER